MARGDYVLYLDADDELLKNGLTLFHQGVQAAHTAGLRNPLLVAGHQTVFPDGRRRIVDSPQLSSDQAANFRRHINSQKRIAVCGSYVVPRAFYAEHRFPTQLPTAEDFVYCGLALARLPHWRIPEVTARIYRQHHSRRSSVILNCNMIEQILGILFDEQVMPKRLLRFRGECAAALYLSGFRRTRKNGNYRAALAFWRIALRTHAPSALRANRLLDLVRMCAQILVRA
jgi:hypothetical protein